MVKQRPGTSGGGKQHRKLPYWLYSLCFEWSAVPAAIPQKLSPSFRRLRSLRPWAIQDSREYLVRTKGFAIVEHIQCKFEGLGSSDRCRCEDFKQQKSRSAITGLHSNWVTSDILATARPADALIHGYNIVEQFQACGLGAIFNLQEPGEHGECGPGILAESGFSYTPEILMKNGIFYYNFPWRDMTSPSVDYTYNIVAVMDFHVSRGIKVAVHCHSGLGRLVLVVTQDFQPGKPFGCLIPGRTGLVIACYLVFSGQQSAVTAVELVRKHRPGALQTKQQVLHVKEFEDYIAGLKIVFVQPWQTLDDIGTRGTNPTLEVLISRQRKILHGDESRLLRYTPKVLVYIIKELSKRVVDDPACREKIAEVFLQGMANDFVINEQKTFIEYVEEAKKQLNTGNWKTVRILSVEILLQLFMDWLSLLEEPLVPDEAIAKALSRGKVQGANLELKKGGKCCFYTVRLLACWMLQVAPPNKSTRRRLFSGLAHLLLHTSLLPKARDYKVLKRHLRADQSDDENSEGRYCPSLLEVEVGLLLEAAAKYWCKLLVIQHKLGSVRSTSPVLKDKRSDELWVYDKAGAEAEILSNPESFEEEDQTQSQENHDIERYMAAACVEEIVNEVSSSFVTPASSFRSSSASSKRSSTPSR